MILRNSRIGSAHLFMLSAKTFLIGVLGLLIICIGSTALYAQNNNTYLNINSSSPEEVTYTGGAEKYTYTLEVKYGRGGNEDAFFTFSSGNSGNFYSRKLMKGGEPLEYQLYSADSQNNVLKSFATQNFDSSNALSLHDITPGTYTIDYVLSLPGDQHVSSGSYMDSVTVKGYLGTINDDPREMQTVTIDYLVNVPPNVKIAIISPNASKNFSSPNFSLDFGQLPGEEQAFDIIVDASIPYSIAVRSSNGGELVNISNPESTSTAPYIFKLATRQIDLNSRGDTTIITSSQPSHRNGDSYRASVRVLDFESIDPGMYQDILTFTIVGN